MQASRLPLIKSKGTHKQNLIIITVFYEYYGKVMVRPSPYMCLHFAHSTHVPGCKAKNFSNEGINSLINFNYCE